MKRVWFASFVLFLVIGIGEGKESDGFVLKRYANGVSPPVQCIIYCQGAVLGTLQSANFDPDSKTFVDMPLKYDPDVVYNSFLNLPNNSIDNLKKFMSDNFLPAGTDIIPWIPDDFDPNPPFLEKLNGTYRQFASDLNTMWKSLGKTLHPDVLVHPQRYSIIPQPYPFIVPGQRFREFYYWDSYWIISGLMVCNMYHTAKGIIQNAINLIKEFGFVPNGARVYYLNRSQPPLLSEMVYRYVSTTGDLNLLVLAIPSLITEYQFWMGPDHLVQLDAENALNRYFSKNHLPRPESYREDVNHSAGMDQPTAESFYLNIATGAETGEDFSSRWFRVASDIRTIRASTVIPVDLNSFLYKFERNMVEFYKMLNTTGPVDFEVASRKRKVAMDKYLWNETAYQWFDYSLEDHVQLQTAYPSNWFPLWSGAFDSNSLSVERMIVSLQTSDLIQVGGVRTTPIQTGEQWDSPNAWAPHQSLLIQALNNLNTPTSTALAQKIAVQWIEATLTGYQTSQLMREKYNAFVPGAPGLGGEYPPQIGFGWTNGVTLEFLNQYASIL